MNASLPKTFDTKSGKVDILFYKPKPQQNLDDQILKKMGQKIFAEKHKSEIEKIFNGNYNFSADNNKSRGTFY